METAKQTTAKIIPKLSGRDKALLSKMPFILSSEVDLDHASLSLTVSDSPPYRNPGSLIPVSMPSWTDTHYKEIMLVAMLVEITLIVILVAQGFGWL